MTQSRNETDRARKGYAIVGIVLVPIVLLAFVNGFMAFLRVFIHTLGTVFVALEIALGGLVLGAIGFWLVQRDRNAGNARMQAMLEQLLQQKNLSLSLVDFADRVELPVAIVRGFLDAAMRERQGSCQLNDRGEIIYHFPCDPDRVDSVKTVDVEAISTDKIDSAATTLFTSASSSPSPTLEVGDAEVENDRSEPQNSNTDDSIAPLTENEQTKKSQKVENLSVDRSEKSLIQAQLARRLSLSSSTLSYRKLKPDFSQWVRKKDPESIAWRYCSETQKFYPK